MSGNQNKYTCLVDSGSQVSTISLEHAKELGLEIFDEYGNIVSQRDALKEPKATSTNTKKKSRYFKFQKQLKSLEISLELLDDDMLELKREIDDIKKSLLDMKCPALQKIQSKKKKVIRNSNSSVSESESE